MGSPDPSLDDESPAERAAHDHGVPLTESQRATRESLAEVMGPPDKDEDEA